MSEAVVKKVDAQGRIAIPAKWRGVWKTRKIALVKSGDRIEIVPLSAIKPSQLFDSIEVSGDTNLTDIHALKKALTEKKGT